MKLPFCVACWAADDLQHHHLVTRKEGGSNDGTNLVTLCTVCHHKLHQRQMNGTYNHSENVKAALARARVEGKSLGRRRTKGATNEAILELRNQGLGMLAIGRKLGCGTGRVRAVVNGATTLQA